FQSYALYPHMTVYDNMAFGMKIAKASKADIDQRVRAAAEKLQLTEYLDRLPKALSGGQRQRVAIGRAIVRDPKVFLFDEPLSNLDAALRVATRIEIAKLKESMPDATMIYVTHDQVEAMTLADRIVVLSGGYVEQVGAPMDLYEDPHNLFVARFIGSPAMNILPATVEQTGSHTVVSLQSGDQVSVPVPSADALKGASVHFGVRPEDLRLANGEGGILHGSVSMTESLGEVTLAYMDGTGSQDPMTVKLPGNQDIRRGQPLSLSADAAKLHLFNDAGVSFRHLN
ncbi:MAG: ATP-binding cassette domain-containing protein, partial [Pseudomonadota bacterium]